MVLVLAGALVWNLSTRLQVSHRSETFSEFMARVDSGQVGEATITGNEITYRSQADENFKTYAPPQYEGLANKLIERNVALILSSFCAKMRFKLKNQCNNIVFTA